MASSRSLRRAALAAAGTVAVITIAPAGATGTRPIGPGPNTVTHPYVVPVAPGVEVSSLLTVNDGGKADDGFEMVGIPDGLGAYRDAQGNVVALMNHELAGASGGDSPRGAVRRHGQPGAFVSRLVIDPQTLGVKEGSDFINPFDASRGGSRYYDYPTGTYRTAPSDGETPPPATAQGPAAQYIQQPAAFGRFCSGYLSEPGELFNEATGRGYEGQIYFANEEVGTEGRAFGVTTDGQAYQLPRLGLFSWENTVSATNFTDTTVVMGNDDSSIVSTPGTGTDAQPLPQSGGEVSVYVGTKQKEGNPFERAGLTNGRNHYMKIPGIVTDGQFRRDVGTGVARRFELNDIEWDQSGGRQSAESLAEGSLLLNRVEDGAFDPRNRNDYYFVTTAGASTRTNGTTGGGLWRMRFDDIDNPAAGGSLTLLLDGSEGLNSPDNMDITDQGDILIQEDPGNNPVVARIMSYKIGSGQLATVAQFDPAKFAPGPANFTTDEESSGIIDVSDLFGPGTFLFDAQIHTGSTTQPRSQYPEDVRGTPQQATLVENGQLMLMKVDFTQVYANGKPDPVL